MNRTSRILSLFVLAALSARAEVSVIRSSGGAVTPYFEPSTRGPWTSVRSGILAQDVLNPDGDLTTASWPIVYTNAAGGRPEVVWSTGGENGDIFFASHDGARWVTLAPVSEAAGLDSLPAVAVDQQGNRFISWHRSRNGRLSVFVNVVASDFARGAGWELSARRNDARRPSLGVSPAGDLYVVYEEQDNSGNAPVSIAIDRVGFTRDTMGRVQCGGENSPVIARNRLFTTLLASRGAAADVRVHVENGTMWVDWVHQDGSLGWSRLNGTTFGDPGFETVDPAQGQEAARAQVRRTVLGLP